MIQTRILVRDWDPYEAQKKGWKSYSALSQKDAACPADVEEHGFKTCVKCMACHGAIGGVNIKIISIGGVG